MRIIFKNTEGQAIKTWHNMEEHPLPMIGDIVVLHWGDYNQNELRYIVKQRVFDGCNLDKIEYIVELLSITKDI